MCAFCQSESQGSVCLCVRARWWRAVVKEDELECVVIIMSQQLPDTVLFIKLDFLFLFLTPWLLPLPLNQNMLAFTISFFRILFLMQKHLREVKPVSDRKGLWGRRVSGLFFLQTGGGKGGGCFLAVVTREACSSFALSHRGVSVSQLSFD